MSKAEIIAELARLSPEDRAEVQAKLDELAGNAWQDRGELSDADKQTLDATLAEYDKTPDAGNSWDQTKARVQAVEVERSYGLSIPAAGKASVIPISSL
jgi:hypothetical protein